MSHGRGVRAGRSSRQLLPAADFRHAGRLRARRCRPGRRALRASAARCGAPQSLRQRRRFRASCDSLLRARRCIDGRGGNGAAPRRLRQRLRRLHARRSRHGQRARVDVLRRRVGLGRRRHVFDRFDHDPDDEEAGLRRPFRRQPHDHRRDPGHRHSAEPQRHHLFLRRRWRRVGGAALHGRRYPRHHGRLVADDAVLHHRGAARLRARPISCRCARRSASPGRRLPASRR